MAAVGISLGIDFGTSNTVAVLRRGDDPGTPLLFDASPLLASGVFASPDGELLTGADAQRAAAAQPGGYEPSPKRLIDDGTVWLNEQEFAVVDVIAAVLARVAREARRVAGARPERVTLTHPAAWGPTRLGTLAEAARRAGLDDATFVAEPVAAAVYFASMPGRAIPVGRSIVAFDLGAGTFDVSVVRRDADGYHPVAGDGLADLGGADLDAVVVDHARALTPTAAGAWAHLDWPDTATDQRARRTLWDGARAAKEQLSRHAAADIYVPLVEAQIRMTRDEFERAARPLLERSVTVTLGTLRSSGVPREALVGVFLVGGSSRVPLVAGMVHRALRLAPTVIEQPELAVAYGSVRTMAGPSEPSPAAAREPADTTLETGPPTAVPRAPRRRPAPPVQRPARWRVAEVLTVVALVGSVGAAFWLAWSVFRTQSPADAATVLGLQSIVVTVLLPFRPWRLIQPSDGIDFVLAICAWGLTMPAVHPLNTEGFFVPLSATVTTIAVIAALCALVTHARRRRAPTAAVGPSPGRP